MTPDNDNPPPVSRRLFIGGSAAAVAASSLAASAATAASASPAFAATRRSGGEELMVGAGKAELEIPVTIYEAEGYASVHDPLHVRVVLFKTSTQDLVLVVYDLTSFNSTDAITKIRAAITKVSGVAAGDIVVTVTHHFSGPHVGMATSSDGTTWIDNIVSATTSAITDAVNGLRKARVGYGSGRCDVNVNRNLLTADGYYLGPNEDGPSDKTVEVARFDDAGGNPIAILTNYSVQSSVMGASGIGPDSATSGNPTYPYEVSADLAGAAATWVEDQYSGVVAPFLSGATGDQEPRFRSRETLINKDLVTSTEDAGSAGWLLLTRQGQRLGTEIVKVAQSITTAPTSDLALVVTSTTVPTVAAAQGQTSKPQASHTWTIDGTQSLMAWIFRIGDGVFAGTPPELSTPTLLAIRENSQFQHTFVMSMFEGGNKNMPDRWNYEHITYESLDGNWAPGDAEKYVSFVGPVIQSLH